MILMIESMMMDVGIVGGVQIVGVGREGRIVSITTRWVNRKLRALSAVVVQSEYLTDASPTWASAQPTIPTPQSRHQNLEKLIKIAKYFAQIRNLIGIMRQVT